MSNGKYLRDLVDIARREIPALEYDIQNASTPLALRPSVEKMFSILRTMLYQLIELAYSPSSQPTAPATAAASPIAPAPAPKPIAPAVPVSRPVAQPARPATSSDALLSSLPPLPSSSPSVPQGHPTIPGAPEPQAGVTNVTITPQGTHVVAPTGARSQLPPGVPVDLTASTGAPPELPEAEPGVTQVILPPGGGMSPEVAQALAARSTDVPPQT